MAEQLGYVAILMAFWWSAFWLGTRCRGTGFRALIMVAFSIATYAVLTHNAEARHVHFCAEVCPASLGGSHD
jgi:hypothetical protein